MDVLGQKSIEMNDQQQRHNETTARRLASLALRLVLSLTIALCFATPATAATPNEHDLKVAYLYNFTRYISWPAEALNGDNNDFVIGVIGENPFGTTLDRLAKKKKAKKRRIVVKYFKSLADYESCHLLFVSSATDPQTRAAIIRQTRNQPVLLVGETEGYGEAGSTINFVLLQDGSINIEINIDAMNRRKMQANALLLKLATVVRDQGA